jgi:hypothetical protein
VNANENKWLIVEPTVILTPSIEPVIVELDEWFRMYQCRSFVTSGKRTPAQQFIIIRDAAIERGLDKEFPSILHADLNSLMVLDGQTVPVWRVVLSKLLTIGFLVNPPMAACVLFDYVHPKHGKIPAGTLIQPSPHFKGTSFDIGGRGESADKTIGDELDVLKRAFDSGSVSNLLSYTVERENNALHCDCKRA